ncbi:MAG: hypothetical protein Q9221_006588 [Calogaya cf. arnoldii]
MPSPPPQDRLTPPGSSHRQRPSHRSPPSRSRSRSRSPPRRRNDDKPKISTGGFKWKDKSKNTEFDRSDERRLERGYRDRGAERDDRNGHRDRDRNDEARRERDRDNHQGNERDRYGDRDRNDERSSRPYDDSTPPNNRRRRRSSTPSARVDPTTTTTTTTKAPKGSKPKKPKTPKIAPTAEPMIIVNVNDRLGTKTAIPCLASDSIGDFKKLVGAHIGRKPHEIMLKRQGERPFKDILTLEDYGVSHGVQLDLEVDTGD